MLVVLYLMVTAQHQAYGAAWLGSRDTVLRTGFPDWEEHGEPASFAMFFSGARALKVPPALPPPLSPPSSVPAVA